VPPAFSRLLITRSEVRVLVGEHKKGVRRESGALFFYPDGPAFPPPLAATVRRAGRHGEQPAGDGAGSGCSHHRRDPRGSARGDVRGGMVRTAQMGLALGGDLVRGPHPRTARMRDRTAFGRSLGPLLRPTTGARPVLHGRGGQWARRTRGRVPGHPLPVGHRPWLSRVQALASVSAGCWARLGVGSLREDGKRGTVPGRGRGHRGRAGVSPDQERRALAHRCVHRGGSSQSPQRPVAPRHSRSPHPDTGPAVVGSWNQAAARGWSRASGAAVCGRSCWRHAPRAR